MNQTHAFFYCPLLVLCFWAVGQTSAQIASTELVINELLASNDTAYTPDGGNSFPDAIELRNLSGQDINLSGYRLSDDDTTPSKWTFPSGASIPAGGLLIVIANGENTGLQTSFKLSASGEPLLLSTPTGTLIQQIDFPRQRVDISYGRLADGSYAFFPTPSIGSANDDSNAIASILKRPQTDQESGIYSGSLAVTLTAAPGVEIRYTTDGSQPTSNSPVYSSPFSFTETTVLKSISLENGLVSDVASRSFIFTSVQHDLPVVIITSDNFEDSRADNQIYGTFNIDGRIRFDFLETDGSLPISQYAEFRTSGRSSSIIPPINGKITARSRYGRGSLNHRFFPEKTEDKFERILIRNTSQDYSVARLRDGIFSRIISEGNIVEHEHEGYRPAVVYLNGQYIGHLNIREDDDSAFVRQYYDLTEPVVLGRSFDSYGNAFAQFRNALPNRNSADAIIRLGGLVNVEEAMLDETLRSSFEVFEGTSNWTSADPTHPRRTSLHDYDFGLGFPNFSSSQWSRVRWDFSLTMSGDDTRFWHEGLQSAAAYLQHLGYPERVDAIIDAAAAEIRSEMPRTIQFYNDRRDSSIVPRNRDRDLVVEDMAEWEGFVTQLKNFASVRLTGALEQGLSRTYGFGIVEVDIRSNDTAMGDVKVHGYRVAAGRETGDYFANIPLRMRAEPKPGFAFTGWTGDVPSADQSDLYIEVSLGSASMIQANFAPTTLTLAISEIYYNPPGMSEDDEFIELINFGDSEIDISGVHFSQGLTYAFPPNTILAAGARIVLRPTDYTGKLDNDGETLTLNDAAGTILESITFDDGDPWPASADDGGHSLVRISPETSEGSSEAGAWRPSLSTGGNPMTSDHLALTDNSPAGILSYAFGSGGPDFRFTRIDNGTVDIGFEKIVNADAVRVIVSSSPDLGENNWTPVPIESLLSEGIPVDGRETISIESVMLGERKFYRLEVIVR